MASTKLICRVCGKEYTACRTMKKQPGVFHWQEVACSPECGTEYLNRVMEARGQTTKSPDKRYAHKTKDAHSKAENVAQMETDKAVE